MKRSMMNPPVPASRAARLLACRVLDSDSRINEASVRLPPRSHVYVAVFTGPDGGQVSRSTGQTDYQAALEIARQWEAEARQIRQRRVQPPIPLRTGGVLSQAQVAAILRISERAVRETEKRAMRKLRAHPLLREIWRELSSNHPDDLDESLDSLTPEEAHALLALAKNQTEIEALRMVFRLVGVVVE